MNKRKTIGIAERGEGSFRYTSSGTLEYRFSYKDKNGISRRKSVTARDMKECYRKAGEFLSKLDFISNGGDPDKTIPGILKESYDKDLKMGFVGEQGYCRNLSNLKVLEKTGIGSKPIRVIRKDEVRDCFDILGKHYSNSLIKQFFRAVKLAFKLAGEQGLITYNFMEDHDMKCPKIGKPVKKVSGLTREHQKKLIDALEAMDPPYGRNDYRLQLFIEMYSGMRMGEINALRREDIDLDNNVIYVRSTISRGLDYKEFVKNGTKTDTGKRKIPISKALRPYLEEALAQQKPNKDNLIFYDYNKNDVISTIQVNSFYQRICRKIGIPADGQHALRHTFATRCIESGIPAVVLKTWLGHRDIHTTLDTYTDVFNSLNHSAVDNFDKYIDDMQ